MLRGLAIVVVVAASAGSRIPRNAAQPADLVVLNAKILTVDERFREAQALAVRDGRFVAVGSTGEVRTHIDGATRVIDGGGRTVIPGLIDSHVHALGVAAAEASQPFPEPAIDWRAAGLDSGHGTAGSAGTWIWTPRVYPPRLRERRFPTRQELDAAAPHHPIAVDGAYAFSLNSMALRAAGVTRASADPPGGAIVKDARGEPTGLLRNVGAMLARFQPGESAAPPLDMLERVHRQAYVRTGITSVIEAGAHRSRGIAHEALQRAGRLNVRATVTFRIPHPEDAAQVERFITGLPFTFGSGDDWLKVGPLKIFVDGGILLGTAFMRDPHGAGARLYGDRRPRVSWLPDADAGADRAAIAMGHKHGWQMVAHVTGDAGVDAVLDAFEAAQEQLPSPDSAACADSRLLCSSRLGRARRAPGACSSTPSPRGTTRMRTPWPRGSDASASHISSDCGRRRGRRRRRDQHRPHVRPRSRRGDEPVQSVPDHVRRDDGERSPARSSPAARRSSREEALRMMTSAAARFSFDEKTRGSIEVGKVADFVVLDTDIMTCPPDRLRAIQPEMTVIGGRVAYERTARR